MKSMTHGLRGASWALLALILVTTVAACSPDDPKPIPSSSSSAATGTLYPNDLLGKRWADVEGIETQKLGRKLGSNGYDLTPMFAKDAKQSQAPLTDAPKSEWTVISTCFNSDAFIFLGLIESKYYQPDMLSQEDVRNYRFADKCDNLPKLRTEDLPER